MCNHNENRNGLKVAFIGGCISFPIGLENDKVYHALLKNALSEIDIKMDKYYTYSELLDTSKEFIQRDSIEVLFLFARHFPYMVLNKPFIRFYGMNTKVKYSLHPWLMNYKMKVWPKYLDTYISEYRHQKIPKRKYFGLRDINSILGKILGLHNWAFRYIEKCIVELNEVCIANGIKLVVIGPTKNPETFMGDRICTYLNNRLVSAMSIKNIDFIDINSYTDKNEHSIFQPDNIHFNEFGHVFLCDKIKTILQQIIRSSLNLNQPA